MHRMYEHGTKARLSFSVNMVDSVEEVNVSGEKNGGNGTFATMYCSVFCKPSFCKSLKFFGTSIASGSRNSPTTSSYILSAMFTGACGSPEKLL